MNEQANSEPVEDRIARAIRETLEPFVVSLLAALITPSQCVQGIDAERDDQRRKAIEAGRMLLDETRTTIKEADSFFERHGAELSSEAVKEQQQLSSAKDWLYLDMKLGDDSFRRHLRELKAPKKIQDLDAMAHYRALVKLKLGGLLIADRAADGDLFGYWITKKVAAEYLALERKAGSDAVAKSRKKP
jgi:hypothetical protein